MAVLFSSGLAGPLPPGELADDDVIVVLPSLPTATAASAAQEQLLAAGASWAAVLGPEETTQQIEHLVTDGLTLRLSREALSGRAMFANGSARLRSATARVLLPMLPMLRRPEVTAVITGYASAPGSARLNQRLSLARAEAVRAFLVSHRVSATDLLVAGHGARDLLPTGPARDNRRVVVVVEQPSPGSA